MPTITSQEVEQMAKLGRLRLTPLEVEQFTSKLGDVLEHFAKIQAIETKGIAVADDVSGLRNIVRPDEAQANKLCSPEALLAGAPAVHRGHIQVTAVFE